MIGDLSLYFHIPFCKKKCPYCHFFVMTGVEKHEEEYMKALKMEWDLKLPLIANRPIRSIYLGGGTPTELSCDNLVTIIKWVTSSCYCDPKIEITVESNPENISATLIAHLKEAGVNRLSLGVQSLETSNLVQIGRTHTPNIAKEALLTAYRGGITNLTIDLLYDLPLQSRSDLEKTLTRLKELPITHLSFYNLVLEPGTAFHRKSKKIIPLLPKEEESLEMLELAIEKFQELGLHRYEISAFCKKGFESLHNMRYWEGKPFFGYGPSAFSYEEGSRFQNVCNFASYTSKLEQGSIPIDFEEKLAYPDNIKELIAVGLRMLKGVDLKPFYPLPPSLISCISMLEKEGFLKKEKDLICLTQRGLKFYDTVASEII
jgi:oxygen-independent coproporphyrinogen-3 oxidase